MLSFRNVCMYWFSLFLSFLMQRYFISYWFCMSRFLSFVYFCIRLHQTLVSKRRYEKLDCFYWYPTRMTHHRQCRFIFTLYLCNVRSRPNLRRSSHCSFALHLRDCERWRFQIQWIWDSNAYLYLFLLQYYNDLIVWQTCIILQTVLLIISVFMLTNVK